MTNFIARLYGLLKGLNYLLLMNMSTTSILAATYLCNPFSQ